MKHSIQSIQLTRGLAASMVVIFHAQCLMINYETRIGLPQALLNASQELQTIGASGVNLFFVISGFVMAYITYGQNGKPGYQKRFIKRRLERIVPVYWFYTLLMAALLFFAPQLFNSARFDIRELLLSLSFIPYEPNTNPTAPILQVGWTLSYEMYFYFLIALGLFMRQSRFALALGVFFALSVMLRPQLPIDKPVINMLTSPMLLEFYAGFVCGAFYNAGKNIHPFLAIVLTALGILGYIAWAAGFTLVPLSYCAVMLITGCVFLEKQVPLNPPKVLLVLGDISFSLYLSHPLVIPALGKICTKLGFWNLFSADAFIVFSLIVCVVCAFVLYHILEKPLIRLFSQKSTNPPIPIPKYS